MAESMSLETLLKKLEGPKAEEIDSVENFTEKTAEALDSNSEISYNNDIKKEEQEHLNDDEQILEKIAQARDMGIIIIIVKLHLSFTVIFSPFTGELKSLHYIATITKSNVPFALGSISAIIFDGFIYHIHRRKQARTSLMNYSDHLFNIIVHALSHFLF